MKLKPFSLHLLASLVFSGGLLGCQATGTGPADKPSFGSLAHITSMSPDPSQGLRSGDTVQLSVDVQYVLTAGSGTIDLVVLAADHATLAQDAVVVKRGHGKVTLRAEFTVPATPSIQLFTPLIFDGQDSTAPADGRAFQVLPR